MVAVAAESSRVLSVPQWALIGFSIALFAAVLVLFIAPIWALIEAATTDREAWRGDRPGQDRLDPGDPFRIIHRSRRLLDQGAPGPTVGARTAGLTSGGGVAIGVTKPQRMTASVIRPD